MSTTNTAQVRSLGLANRNTLSSSSLNQRMVSKVAKKKKSSEADIYIYIYIGSKRDLKYMLIIDSSDIVQYLQFHNLMHVRS